jgi:RNA polymerase sigma factor (sigma-70 family)
MSIPQPLSNEEQIILIRQAQQGDRRARETLIRTNEGLLWYWESSVNIARYAEQEDVIQAGRIGINRAIDRFREDKGATFATYSGWWIRSEMQRTIAEVVTLGGFRAKHALFDGRRSRSKKELSALTRHAAGGMFRLDAPVGDEDMTFADQLLSETPLEDEQLIRAISDDSHARAVETIFSILKPRQITVAERRFMQDEPDSLEAIGQDFGVTRERVRQIETQVLNRLARIATRHPTVVEVMRELRDQRSASHARPGRMTPLSDSINADRFDMKLDHPAPSAQSNCRANGGVLNLDPKTP